MLKTTIGAVLLWIAAAFIAVGLVLLARRGRPLTLRGRVGPRLLRAVATVLVVVFGVGIDRARADEGDRRRGGGEPEGGGDPVRAGETAPDDIDAKLVKRWRDWQIRYGERRRTPYWHQVIEAIGAGRPERVEADTRKYVEKSKRPLARLMAADLAAIVAGVDRPAPPCADILAALDELEGQGAFDPVAHAYLFRATRRADGTREERIRLFARLHRHARLIDAFARARFNVKAAAWRPRSWMSKAGPSTKDRMREAGIRRELLAEVRRVWASTGSGIWQSDATVEVTIGDGSAPLTIERAGERLTRVEGQPVRIGRLDVLITPPGDAEVVLTHTYLPDVRLPPDRLLTVFDLPATLGDAARLKLRATVEAALEGDETAALWLERTLPFSHEAIREGLDEQPGAPGAPRLRTILTLFDEKLVR